MQKCRYCRADLLENTRFCGNCGGVQDAFATDAAATSSNTPPQQSWAPESDTIPASLPPPSSSDPALDSVPTWFSNGQVPGMLPPVAEDEDERRRGIPSWSSLSGVALGADVLLSSGPSSLGAPVVPGTPQIGTAPSVAGSPTLNTNVPVSHPVSGPPTTAPISHPVSGPPTTAPISHPVSGPPTPAPVSHPASGPPTTAPISHPVSGPPTTAPVSHPVSGPPTPAPVSHPVSGPLRIHHRPEQPGTQKHHRPHEPKRSHTHSTHLEPHRVARAAKTAGVSAKTIILVVTAIVVVAGGIGAAVHFLGRPPSFISISSNYKVGSAAAGASGTILHIGGQNFPSNAPITFLLDGHAAPGSSGAQSDSNGTFRADVTITNAWSVGTHTLTASSASNDSPKNSVSVMVVQPGQANTPGPNGAPPDDASFRLKVTIAYEVADPFSQNPVLIVTGHPDPEGGTVCSPDDSGQSFTFNVMAADGTTPFTKTLTATCSGTYKAGQINYIETSTSLKQLWQVNGANVTCVQNNPTVDLRLTGAYAGNNTFTGTMNSPYFTYTCDQGNNTYHEAFQGTWTGTIVK